MTRSIPPALARLVELLELERPATITTAQLAALGQRAEIATPAYVAIQRLAARGWLLPTGVRGVWEFSPADRAGPYSEGDPFLPLRASIAQGANVGAVALGSAMSLLNLTDRSPDVPEVAIPTKARVPAALDRAYRIIRFDSRLPPTRIRDLPVQEPTTILVHLAEHPTHARSWAAVLEALPALANAASQEHVAIELRDRPHATRARFAYLLSDIAPALVERLGIRPAGRVWFGPRDRPRRYDARWNIADTLLPFSPSELTKLRSSA